MRDISEVKNKLSGCPEMQPYVSHGGKKDLPAKKGIIKAFPPVSSAIAPWFSFCALVYLCVFMSFISQTFMSHLNKNLPGIPGIR